jgi:MFS family permease
MLVSVSTHQKPAGLISAATTVSGSTAKSSSVLPAHGFSCKSHSPDLNPPPPTPQTNPHTPSDVAFYGLGLNNSIILTAIGYAGGSNVYHIFRNTAVGNLIIVCAGAIPGYWVTVATVDTIGRKPIQLMGFVILTILFCIIGFAYHKLSQHALLALYVLCQFFFNFGPNATTFIVPGECFPTRYRSTSHGLSAASGKVGAIIAQVVFGPLRIKGHVTKTNPSPWLNHVMQIFALFMLCGVFTTLLIPETKRKTLEELAGEVPGTANYDPVMAGHTGSGGRKESGVVGVVGSGDSNGSVEEMRVGNEKNV